MFNALDPTKESMEKKAYRTVEYYQALFMDTGKEFDMKKLYEAAKAADDLYELPKRSDAAYQVWASNILRDLQKQPALATITKSPRGRYEKIVIHDPDKCAAFLGRGTDTESEKPTETPKAAVAEIQALTKEDQFVIACKALRCAVRTSNGGAEAKLKPENLMEACLHKERFPEIAEIIQAVGNLGLDITVPIIEEKERLVVFRKHCSGLKKVCERGAELFPARWKTLFNFKASCDAAYNNALETIKSETEDKSKKPIPITSDVFTDDDNFRIFIMGGYLMDQLQEHDNASIQQLGERLEKKGVGLSPRRLEQLIHSVPQFFVDDNEVFLKLEKDDQDTFWKKFRKCYRPLSGEREQVICNIRMDLDEVQEICRSCQVIEVDKHTDGLNTFRIEIPKNSRVARHHFAEFMKFFRKGEKIYTESEFLKRIKRIREKEASEELMEDDLYRYEIGYFKKRRV